MQSQRVCSRERRIALYKRSSINQKRSPGERERQEQLGKRHSVSPLQRPKGPLQAGHRVAERYFE